ncbi:larval cuticle protein 65Ag1-like [Chironomus tepperi]|uniref:larval cuticle protein 65Ag1-like n=1 Tax=Chironomus tepperi TaxID=113505 RepID=UPI00391EEEBF
MKAVIILALIAIASAAPADVGLLEHNEARDDYGQFAYNYLTADGIARTEQGRLTVSADGTKNVFVTSGAYRYLAPDGQIIETHYTADENGFRVTGTHIPVAPVDPNTTV